MFGDVWRWASEFRNTNKNIGVDKFQIGIELRNLIEDGKYRFENHTFNDDEFAVRFSHRVVKIHLFSNGNGRHSRLLGDIIVNHGFNKPVFTWGGKDLLHKGTTRTLYLKALREADEGDYKKLIEFVRK